MKKRLFLAALALAGAMALSGCGGSKSASKNGKILTIEEGPDVETIDPALNQSADGANYITMISDNLLRIDKDGKIAPSMAEKYEVSDDGLTWRFHLRDGLKWSDGSDFTANDFVYSWQRMVDPEVAAPYAETMLGMVEGYKDAIGNPDANGNTTTTPDRTKLKVEATDDKTFVVHMSRPTPYFDRLATFAALSPVKKDVVEANPDGWSLDPKTYVSTGPFKLTEWKQGSHILVTKNENYWNKDAVKLDGIKCLLMQDQNAAFSAYESGEASMIKDYPVEEVTTIQKRPDYKSSPKLGIAYIDINNDLDEFKDPKVREALALALDRKYMADTITAGINSPAKGFIPDGVVDWDGSAWADNITDKSAYYDNDNFDANLAKAKELLNEAGHENGAGLPTMSYTTNDAGFNKKVAEYLQQAWKELGINVEVNIVEWKSFIPQRRSGNYQIARDGWVMDYNDPSNLLECAYSTNGNNSSRYKNTEYDALLDKAAHETDAKTRFGYFHQAEELLLKDAGVIPLMYQNETYLQKDNIKDSFYTSDGIWHFEYADIAE